MVIGRQHWPLEHFSWTKGFSSIKEVSSKIFSARLIRLPSSKLSYSILKNLVCSYHHTPITDSRDEGLCNQATPADSCRIAIGLLAYIEWHTLVFPNAHAWPAGRSTESRQGRIITSYGLDHVYCSVCHPTYRHVSWWYCGVRRPVQAVTARRHT